MVVNISASLLTTVMNSICSSGDVVALMTTNGSSTTSGVEVSGGSYARQDVTWYAPSSGTRSNSTDMIFSGLPDCELQGWETYNGSSRRQFGVFEQRSGSASQSTGQISSTAHGFADGDPIVFLYGYAPSGCTYATTYYVRDATTDSFAVAATAGGAALPFALNSGVVFGRVLVISSGQNITAAPGTFSLTLG